MNSHKEVHIIQCNIVSTSDPYDIIRQEGVFTYN